MLIDFRGKKYEHTVCYENNTLSYCVRPVTHLGTWEDYAKLPALTIRRNCDGYIFESTSDEFEALTGDEKAMFTALADKLTTDELCVSKRLASPVRLLPFEAVEYMSILPPAEDDSDFQQWVHIADNDGGEIHVILHGTWTQDNDGQYRLSVWQIYEDPLYWFEGRLENEDWWKYISDDTCDTLDAHVESMWDDLCEHFETEVKEYYSDMLTQMEANDNND